MNKDQKNRPDIFVVEDDQAILLGIEQLLLSENFSILSSSDGLDAIDKILSYQPGVVLLDVNLPSLNGLDVCRKLRENGFKKTIIMLTSRSEQIDKVLGLELGADDYITKPFDSRELIARIRAHLRKYDREISAKVQAPLTTDYKRKLLSLMFTDIKDYSKKMHADEKAAMALLQLHNKILSDTISAFNGNVVEVIGDAFLASFESAVDAVLCAVEIQKKIRVYNKSAPLPRQMQIRIGLHLGDVLILANEIKRDAVNIAARIQQTAKPASILISEEVYNSVKNKIDVSIISAGSHKLKNIGRTVNLYRIKM